MQVLEKRVDGKCQEKNKQVHGFFWEVAIDTENMLWLNGAKYQDTKSCSLLNLLKVAGS